MESYILTLALGSVLFFAVVVLLTVNPKYVTRATMISCIIAAVLGLLLYGYGYVAISDNPLQAVFRAVFAVCRMFIGESDFGDIESVAIFELRVVTLVFWACHLLAFYATASAALSVIGAKALKKARLWLGREEELSIIYGINADSVEFGKKLEETKKSNLVFVDGNPDSSMGFAIEDTDLLLRSDSKAAEGTPAFLRGIGACRKKRKITLYALSKDSTENVRYARKLLASMKDCGIDPSRTTLVLYAREDLPASNFQNSQDAYGFGFVTVFQEHGLVARLLIRHYPPCDYISFDDKGRSTEDFHMVMVGFGRIGQTVLRQLIMNGQFAGGKFRAAVFAPDCETASGFFFRQFRSILDHFDITFFPHDGRSTQLYDYLTDHRDIKYVVINTGSEKLNNEISEEISQVLQHQGNSAPVFQCSYQGIRVQNADTSESVLNEVYAPEVLSMHTIDSMAMIVNQHYMGSSSNGALQDWLKCDYFSRMSCRAFADFIRAYLRAAGKTQEEAMAGDWDFSSEVWENLSIMEHERWCAFHYCMGFNPMTAEEYSSRAATYLEQIKTPGVKPLRIGKNLDAKTHACLIGWDELDALSQREFAITGKKVNYKDMDTENVRIIPKLLRVRKEMQ